MSQDELNVTTRALIVHINAQIPVKQISQAVAASNTKAESTSRKPQTRKTEVSASPARKPEISKPPASTVKMWLYQAKNGWTLTNIGTMHISKVTERLEKYYGCKILATKDDKINFLPTRPTTIDALLAKGLVIYRPEMNKIAA
ncbi:hypothetical protein [Synechococcus sp. BA-132 BA5]|uniref:hypothetical protein n=1 Tax=Synechococcus sp. BA-132 BA5 TaxID=3110252 RepID=UPI002B219906|nr:hypothetical protein [Synechococcus sp. BA-132 BA5]